MGRLRIVTSKGYTKEQAIANSGLSDIFGKKNNICQAIVLWNIRNKFEI